MKKTLSLILFIVMIISVSISGGLTALAEPGDVIVTVGASASGDGWNFDGNNFTFSGADIAGDLHINCGESTQSISFTTTDDSRIAGTVFCDFSSNCFAVEVTFSSQNNAELSIGSLMGGGTNNDTIIIDGAIVTVGFVSIGASGAGDSFLVVKNGSKLTINDSIMLQNIVVSDASELTINALEYDFSNALVCAGNENFSFDMDDLSSVFLNANNYAVISEGMTCDFSAFLARLPDGSFKNACDEYYCTLYDKDGNPIKNMVLGAAAPVGISEGHKVSVKTTESATTPDVYSVDVEWGAMEFTYNVGGTRVWDADTHTYTDNSSASWSAVGNTVTVTNHSNKDITAVFSFAKDSAITETITGTFDITSEQLDAGVENGYDSADKVVSTLTVGGALDASRTSLVKVGTVTVTIQ